MLIDLRTIPQGIMLSGIAAAVLREGQFDQAGSLYILNSALILSRIHRGTRGTACGTFCRMLRILSISSHMRISKMNRRDFRQARGAVGVLSEDGYC